MVLEFRILPKPWKQEVTIRPLIWLGKIKTWQEKVLVMALIGLPLIAVAIINLEFYLHAWMGMLFAIFVMGVRWEDEKGDI